MSLDKNFIKVVQQYLKDSYIKIKDLFSKSYSEGGVYILSGTDAAEIGSYYGFIVLTDTVISAIVPIDSTKIKGDITGITLSTGVFISIPGKFSTITLTSGDIMLLTN